MAETLVTTEELPELSLDAFRADPAATLDALRPHRIVRSSRGFEVIGYDLAYELFADQRLRTMSAKDFSSHGASPYIAEFVDKGVFLFMEPERHKEIRKIFARGFAARKVSNHREHVVNTVDRLIDRLAATGEGDLVADFTQRVSAEVLCSVVGFPPRDIPEFLDAALDLRHLVYVPMQPHIDKIEAALNTLHAYTTELITERRRKPADDFISSLIEAEQGTGKLTTDELIWGTANLLLGGIDTTNFQMASTLYHLITNESWTRVAGDADLREAAIEEAMRLTPISTMLGRIAHERIIADGVEIPVGADVKLNLVGAGRDPERFEDPHAYRLDRRPPYFPIVFGNGIHVCIGRNLAWMELRTAVDRITGRLTNVSLSAPPTMHSWTDAFYGPYTLPATFDVR